jgi:hypothetical protein
MCLNVGVDDVKKGKIYFLAGFLTPVVQPIA